MTALNVISLIFPVIALVIMAAIVIFAIFVAAQSIAEFVQTKINMAYLQEKGFKPIYKYNPYTRRVFIRSYEKDYHELNCYEWKFLTPKELKELIGRMEK